MAAQDRLLAVPDTGAPPEERELLTIEQLAAATGMTVRNIRSHRTSGLLPPPIVRDRVGYYGPDHLARLRLVQELQAEGFNLRGIKRLIDETGGQSRELVHLRRMLTAPFETEQPQVFTLEELAERFGGQASVEALERAQRVRALVPLGDGRFEAPVPSLLDMAEEVINAGVRLDHAMAVAAKVREHCQAIAQEYVRLFLEDVWKPFASEGYPSEKWPATLESIERLRPISSRAVLAVYQLQMSQEVEAAFGRELARLSKGR
jgi:DNA-binding transcriptional MerR regulator